MRPEPAAVAVRPRQGSGIKACSGYFPFSPPLSFFRSRFFSSLFFGTELTPSQHSLHL